MNQLKLSLIGSAALLGGAWILGTSGQSEPASSERLGLEANRAFSIGADVAPRYPSHDGAETLVVELRDRIAGAYETQPRPKASGTILPAARVADLFARLPNIDAPKADVTAFAARPGTPPPPRTGDVVNLPFPPPDSPSEQATTDGGPLLVARYGPRGPVPVAPKLSITFSEPMIALGEQAQANDPPVRLTPTPAGNWRWLGTRTLVFEPETRFPAATDYRVEVRGGLIAANGNVLAEPLEFQFNTPAVEITGSTPAGEAVNLNPLILLEFDQRVEPERIAEFISLRGKQEHPLRFATAEELEADTAVAKRFARQLKDHAIVLVPVAPLSSATQYELTLAQGAPSGEGPATTPETQSFDFSTFDALAINGQHCWGNELCRPGGIFSIQFNNTLRVDQQLAIKVEPEIEHPTFNVRRHGIDITGTSQSLTQYRVTIPGTTEDIFGQSLGTDQVATFRTGPMPRQLHGPPGRLITVDPFGEASVPIFSTNNERLRVRVHRVTPANWPAFQTWSESHVRKPSLVEGEVVFDDWVDVNDADRLDTTSIDLRPYLEGDHGHFAIWVESADRLASRERILEKSGTKQQRRRERLLGSELLYWVQVTELGLTTIVDEDAAIVWVTNLRDGTPVADATVAIAPPSGVNRQETTTDPSGLASLPYETHNSQHPLIVASHNGDTALLPQPSFGYRYGYDNDPNILWYTTDDRGLYKPGETIHLKGWLRLRAEQGKSAPQLPSLVEHVTWTLQGPRGKDLATGQTGLNAHGGFDLAIDIPKDSELGHAYVAFSAATKQKRGHDPTRLHSISIQEFRRPEFEITTRFDSPSLLLGEVANVSVKAAYFAGGGLAMSPIDWHISAADGHYTPPNHDAYSFGRETPWWGTHHYSPQQATSIGEHSSLTDSNGEHHLAIDLRTMKSPRPVVVTARANVEDRNRQQWAHESNLLVHPSELYIGLKAERSFIRVDQTFSVEAIAAAIDGTRVGGVDVTIAVEEASYPWRGNESNDAAKEPVGRCKITSQLEPVFCNFTFEHGGMYRAIAIAADAEGRPNESELSFWVAGNEPQAPTSTQREVVQIIPDRETYQPGDVAELLVQAPFYPAEGLLILGRNGVLRTEMFRVEDATHTLHVPITDTHIAGVHVAVELVGSSASPEGNVSSPRQRVAHAGGSVSLNVPPHTRTLAVDVLPSHDELSPGAETEITVALRDAKGRPVDGAEVALFVVDEAVLALTGFQYPDPLKAFYPSQSHNYASHHLRSQIWMDNQSLPTRPMQNEAEASSLRTFGLSADVGIAEAKVTHKFQQQGASPIALRSNFAALALFAPTVITGRDGRATVPLQIPDSLTRFRVVAIAVSGDDQFGMAESQVTVRLPLMVRPSPPRFLNFGDRFELPIVLQNQTDEAMEVDVAVRASNASITLQPQDSSQGAMRFTVPANDRIEARFPMTTMSPGIARFQVVAASSTATDAASFSFPVWSPATSEAFATYGVLDGELAIQPITPPQDVWPQVGGLEISTSSTQLQALTDAMLYLNNYEFECSEQIASRMLSVVALGDVLATFAVEHFPTSEELISQLQRDAATLADLQQGDGGFGFWHRREASFPYNTIHVAHALARARSAGLVEDFSGWDRLHEYLKSIDQRIPENTSVRTANALRAYSLYTRRLMGDLDGKSAKSLSLHDDLSVEAMGWLLPVLHAVDADIEYQALRRRLENIVSETAATAQFATHYTDGAHQLLHSKRRADAVVLGALIETEPGSDLIPKLVRGLLGHRKQGRWSNTQENAFALLALGDYFKRLEKTVPEFVARFWLGEAYAGEHSFSGRTTDRAHLDIPMKNLLEHDASVPFAVQKQGDGRLYYRLGMRYAPKSFALDAKDHGFEVIRTYRALDHKSDVERADDGTWKIKAGARVGVEVSIINTSRRYHVALVDPMPAGFEIVNGALAASAGGAPQPGLRPGFWPGFGRWFEHQNLRDERAEAFTTLLRAGVHSYNYTTRATTPGEFVAPPTRVEEMYHPETFGRSASTRVVIE